MISTTQSYQDLRKYRKQNAMQKILYYFSRVHQTNLSGQDKYEYEDDKQIHDRRFDGTVRDDEFDRIEWCF